MCKAGRASDFDLLLGAGLEFLVLHQQPAVLDLDRQAVQRPGSRTSDDLPILVEFAAVAGTLEFLVPAVPPEAAAKMRADGGKACDLVRRTAQGPDALDGRRLHVTVADGHDQVALSQRVDGQIAHRPGVQPPALAPL